MSLQRTCRVCESTFEIPAEEIARLAKQDLPIPTRCPSCTRSGERFSTMDDPRFLWGELQADALRRYPRFDPTYYGDCPLCLLGPTAVHPLGPLEVTVCLCSSCRTMWIPVEEYSRVDPFLDDDARLEFIEHLLECVDLDQSPGIRPATIRQEIDSMKRETTTAPKSFGLDPRAYQRKGETWLLPLMSLQQRVGVTDLVIIDLREHPPTEVHRGKPVLNPDGCWHRIRSFQVDTDHTVEDLLCAPETFGPMSELRRLMDLLFSLRDRRQELEEELRALDGVAAAFAIEAPVAVVE